jgi:hypothetical protein
MSSGSKRREMLWSDDAPPTLSWRVWPARERPAGTAIVLGALVFVGLGVHWVTSQTHLAALAAAVLAAALWRFFLPAAFELNPEGVDQLLFGRQRRIRWSAIRRYEICSAGVLLLPFADRSLVDTFRGLYLPWGSHRDEVLFQVRYYLDRSR